MDIFTGKRKRTEIDDDVSTRTNTYSAAECDSKFASTAGDVAVDGDLYPVTDAGNDLGRPTNRWENLYVWDEIFLGNQGYSLRHPALYRRVSSGNQSIPQQTITKVNFDTSSLSTNNDVTYSSGTFTFVTAGIYQISWQLVYAGDFTNSVVETYAYHDAGVVNRYHGSITVSDPLFATETYASSSCLIQADPNDTLIIRTWHYNSELDPRNILAQSTVASDRKTSIDITRIGHF